MPVIPESEMLRAAMVAAYAPYLERVLAERGLGGTDLGPAVDEGTAWLDATLGELLGRPFHEQGRGPLEVFQEAMRFPTAALEEAGAEPAARDAGAAAALPGDGYDLAPASSQALGASVWEAHLAWGAAKARSFRPAIGLLSRDLMDSSKVEPVVREAGFRLVAWRDIAEMESGHERVAAGFVDLAHPDADEAIRRLSGDGIRTIGYGPHVDDLAMMRARTLGAADALPRSAFFRALADLLPRLV
jgi:hypothetical protein